MICPNCGKEVNESASFCGNCGTALNVNKIQTSGVEINNNNSSNDDILDLSDSFTEEEKAGNKNVVPASMPHSDNQNNNISSNNAYQSNNNVAEPNNNYRQNINATPNNNYQYNNTAMNYNKPNQNYNSSPNYNNYNQNVNGMPNYNRGYNAPNQNYYNGSNYNNKKKSKFSILGFIGAIVALVGCFLPIQSVSHLSYSFMDVKKLFDGMGNLNRFFGGSVKPEVQLILYSPYIFIVACIIAFIFSIAGVRAISRLCGIICIGIIGFLLFYPIGGSSFIESFQYVGPGAGVIMMAVGSVMMVISA